MGAENLPRQMCHLYGPVVCMSYGGTELADYQDNLVQGMRDGSMEPSKYLTKVAKIGQDLFAAVRPCVSPVCL